MEFQALRRTGTARVGVAVLFLTLNGVAQEGGTPNPPTALEIVRRSVERDQSSLEQARDYTFIQRQEIRKLGKKGEVKSVESETFEILIIERRPFQRKIAENDKELTGKDKEKAEREFRKEVSKQLGDNEEERREKLAKWEKDRQEERAFLKEVPAAYDFHLAGEEMVEGHPCWIIDAVPRKDFRAETKNGKFLTKFRGRLWIGAEDYQWVKAEAESVETVGIGWFVARLAKGARLSFENARVNNEVWLPKRITFGGAARVMLVAKLNADVTIDFKDYRKFQADSRVVETEALP